MRYGERGARRETGRLHVNPRGFGFVAVGEGRPDVFVAPSEIGDARTGDIVELEIRRAPRGPEGRALRIVERPERRLVARALQATRAGDVTVRPYDRAVPGPLTVENAGRLAVQPGDLLLVEIPGGPPARRASAEARLISVLGRDDDPRLDSRRVAIEFGLAGAFSPEALAEERTVLARVPPPPPGGRRDETAALAVTMDPADAHDFDDAVAIERLGRGRFRVTVYVADLAAYVPEGGPLDAEAAARGTSVYLPDGVVRMLPETLSREGASLVEGAPRPAATVRFTVDAHGRRSEPEVGWSWIRNQARLSYEHAQGLLDGREREQVKGLAEALAWMADAAARLGAARHARGSWDIDLPEVRATLDAEGNPLRLVRAERLATHRIVEEFMIAANETVGQLMAERELPFVYRVHPEPDVDKLQDAFRLARVLRVPVPAGGRSGPVERARRLLEMKVPDAIRTVLHSYVLRSLERARYSPVDTGHSGLGTVGYCHFTSPIRRYPDLVNHRLLLEAEGGRPPSKREREARHARLEEIARRASEQEQLADDAERAAVRTKALRLAAPRLGEEVMGLVVGVGTSAVFIEMDDPQVDGRLPREALLDDYYEVDLERFGLFGRRTGRAWRVGDAVRVVVARVVPETRELEFAPAGAAARRRRPKGEQEGPPREPRVRGRRKRVPRARPAGRKGRRP